MEYQKAFARHGGSQRPDIILHVPAEESHTPVDENNFAVWALKYRGSAGDAVEDFEKLDWMCRQLKYPLALFINVSASATHLDAYTGQYKDRIHAFATPDPRGAIIEYSHFVQGQLEGIQIPL